MDENEEWKPAAPDPFLNARNIALGVATILIGTFFIPVMRLLAPQEHLLALRNDFAELPAPPNSRLVGTNESPTWHHILLQNSYQSAKSYDELKQYYRSLLEREGWRLVDEKSSHDYGRDFGGREWLFCKPPYAANLEYVGEIPEPRGGFTLALSWHLHSICNSKPSN